MPLSGLPRPLLASLYVRSRANSGAVRLKEADQLMGIALAPALQELGFPVLSIANAGRVRDERDNMERSWTTLAWFATRERPYEAFDCRYIGRKCSQRRGCSQEGAVKKGNLCNDLASVAPERSVHRAAAVGQSCGQNGKIPAPL